MATIKCRRCGKTLGTSRFAAINAGATDHGKGSWEHNGPCEASSTPLWSKGQSVTVERPFSGAPGDGWSAAEIHKVGRVAGGKLVLDDGREQGWNLDGSPRPERKGYGGPSLRVRPTRPGDAETIERRAIIGKIVSTRGDVWSAMSTDALRSVGAAIDAASGKAPDS